MSKIKFNILRDRSDYSTKEKMLDGVGVFLVIFAVYGLTDIFNITGFKKYLLIIPVGLIFSLIWQELFVKQTKGDK